MLMARLPGQPWKTGASVPAVFDRRLIVCECILFDEADRAGWTGRQAVAQTIAVIIAQELGLAVYHADRAFVAGLGTETAAVAFLFVDLNNSSFHMVSLRLVFLFWFV